MTICNPLSKILTKNLDIYRSFSTSCLVASSSKVNLFDLNFDRRIKVDYRESIKYMESEAYKKTYGKHKVWEIYKRNYKAQVPSKNSRLTCINDEGFVDTSYPCPICRDEYLVLHHDNEKLISQFINPYTAKLMTTQQCHLCIRQYRNLMIAILRAKDMGTLPMQTPDRLYEYRDYIESNNEHH